MRALKITGANGHVDSRRAKNRRYGRNGQQSCCCDAEMTLLIRDVLLNPPTWFSSFRDLTLYCHVFLRIDCVIETEDADPYYRWIKWRGGMDFVEDFVRPGSERGLRLDVD